MALKRKPELALAPTKQCKATALIRAARPAPQRSPTWPHGRCWEVMARRRRSGSDAGSASYWHVRSGEGAGNPSQPRRRAHASTPLSGSPPASRSTVKSSAPSCHLIGPAGLGVPRPYLPRRIAAARERRSFFFPSCSSGAGRRRLGATWLVVAAVRRVVAGSGGRRPAHEIGGRGGTGLQECRTAWWAIRAAHSEADCTTTS